MYTRCPSCHTLFRILAQQLKAARGQVRCGECQTTFDAIEFLVNRDELSERELQATTTVSDREIRQWHLPFDSEPPLPIFVPPASEELPPGNSSELLSAAQIEMLLTPDSGDVELDDTPSSQEEASITPVPLSAATPEPPPTAPPPEDPAPPEAESSAPPEEPDQPAVTTVPDMDEDALPPRPRYSLPQEELPAPRSRGRQVAWGVAALLSLLLLGGQLALLNRESLAKEPSWRPWLERSCGWLGCSLPTQRDLSAVEMVERSVLSHPDFQKALLITASLTNKATFAQPFPEVELTMTDLEQKPVASRRFLPSEYLSGADPATLFPAGATVRLRLELADPGEEAVGFEFDFY